MSYIEQGSYIVFDNEDGTHLNLTGQQNFSEFNFSSSVLELDLNSTQVRWNTASNKTLSMIQYNLDILLFNASGTDGYLNFTGKMSNSLDNYSFYVDNIFQSYFVSDYDGMVNFNYSGSWGIHSFKVILAAEESDQDYLFDSAGTYYVTVNATNANGTSQTLNWTITADSNGLQVPEIISWGNNITNNQNLSISGNVGQSIRFNATANQSITNWTWSKI